MNDSMLAAPRRCLTPEQRAQYHRWGYVRGLTVFGADDLPALQREAARVISLLPKGVDVNRVNMWHKANRWYYDVCRNPMILDYVEDILGTNFYQWGGQFFVKRPGDGSVVPWHQDAQYWPLTPRRTVTVWLAIYDADRQNGAMQVVRGSHLTGAISHHPVLGDQYVLEQEVDSDSFDPDDVVSIELKAGEISLHDDGLIHGSGPNHSDRMRCGLTMRFSPIEVKADLAVWPTFEVSMARGEDKYHLNPHARVPRKDGFPVRKFQHSSEFA